MNAWLLLFGLVFLGMALTGSYVRRLPLSGAIIYVTIGIVIGPHGFKLLDLRLPDDAELIERITELAIIVSLFGAGLKLRIPLQNVRWLIPFRLAFVSMAVTVGCVAAIGVFFLHLSLGAAIFLGGILAPTDPVLAADVQIEHPFSYNPVRFGLTGEAGLNDGTAMPFVLLGLGLMGLHNIGSAGLRWLMVDLIWRTAAGFAIGTLLGFSVARLVLHMRREHREALGLDDFLALGLVALCYSCSEFARTNSFLAVFAAGLALRRQERIETGKEFPEEAASKINLTPGWREEAATSQELAPVYMAEALLNFNKHLENIGELVVVVLVGALLWQPTFALSLAWVALVLFFIIRPISIEMGLLGSPVARLERHLMSWFGVRGIGTVYYLCYGITHGLPNDIARTVGRIAFTVIAGSIVLHGITVTPVMNWYERRAKSND